MKTTFLKAIAVAGLTASSIAAHAVTELTFWHAMAGRNGEMVTTIVNQFNESQSEYRLTAINKGGYEDTMTAGIAAFRARNAPHIIQVFDAGAATIINAKGAVYPVQDLLEDSGAAFDKNDYLSGVRYFYADSDGKMIGMPFNSSTPLLYYNKEALKKAGIAEPPATWEEFETIAPKLKAAGYTALSQSHSPWIFSENFHSRHNLPMATGNNGYDTTDVKILYNNDALKMHWSKVKDWLDEGYYGYYGRNWGDNQDAFVQGKVAMWLGSSGSFGNLKQTTDFEFGTTFLPYWSNLIDEPKSTFIGGAALFSFSGHSKDEYKGVAEFFKFLTSPETQLLWHKETGYVAITNAAYDLAQKTNLYKEMPDAEVGMLQLSQESGEWSKGYRLGYYVQIRESLFKNYERLLSGQTSVDSAFHAIEQESNRLLRRFNATYK
ncbi:extracellular solute-binding protein [Sansalvadorimonas verongulae]|uniref:extracellular solute-binding protein n=1 Tax=Sansalvadorimonas verongulae TaxID=2172824 RepID=UPI0012BC3176|nr:extracellular solute-binding protein [Sansalvadorimonas verongulae]MTI14470.1 extracellular solute-binding protein [Sansalvadorimonas verongulae]